MKRSLLTLLLSCLSCVSWAASPKLNLLYLTADDMNADSPGWMGSTMGATPVLDALAGTCHRFINNHVTAPICQPSREAMMTGRVPHRSGALGFNPVKPGTPTMVTVLKAAGYYTAGINKTAHMKPAAEFPWDDDLGGSGKNPPLLREHFETTLKNAAAAKKPFFINVNIQYPHRPFPGSGAVDAEEGDSTTPKAKAKKGEGKMTKKKAAKLAGAKADDTGRIYKPEEIKVPDFLEDIPPVRVEVAQYFTAVARVDISLRGVLDALKASGHADDTIILFMSDHGMSFPFSKATAYFNGTRSPVILKWPGMPAASLHEEFVSSVDIMPTLLDLLAVKHPDGMDGRSWLPLLRGEKQDARDFVITHVNTVSSGMSLPQRCIRTKDWALMFHAWPDGMAKFKVEAMSGITYKALEAAGKTDERIAGRVKQLRVGEPLMFFNELTDPSERNNSVADANYAPEIKRLAALLVAHMEQTDDPQTANFKKAMENWKSKPAKN
ncbi:MAG: sulfatase [Verrucomicrobia bacterium]|nr:sulfatase [Verrucomicrobiota bacterium]